jgi:hypothetical protein
MRWPNNERLLTLTGCLIFLFYAIWGGIKYPDQLPAIAREALFLIIAYNLGHKRGKLEQTGIEK